MMKAKLNKTFCEGIEPGPEDITVEDATVPGLQLKVTPKGRRVLQFYYRTAEGQRRRPKIGDLGKITVEDAREIAKEWGRAVARGEDPSAARQEKRQRGATVGELWPEYLADAKRRWKPRTLRLQTDLWEKQLAPAFGHVPLADVTRETFRRFHRGGMDKPTQSNQCLRLLRAFWNWAANEEIVPEGSNPTKGARPHPEKPRERYLRPDELPFLMAAIDAEEAAGGLPAVKRTGESKGRGGKGKKETASRGISRHAAALFRLLLFTGARRDEIRLLQWSFVDWNAGAEGRGCLRLPDSKTGAKIIWLSDWAREELEALYEIRTGESWVIEGRVPGKPLDNAAKPWSRVVARANTLWNEQRQEDGLPPMEPGPFTGLRLHDLRHSLASFSVAAGHSLEVIGGALGHKSTRTTARYSHLRADPVERMVQSVGAVMAEAIAGKRGAVRPVRKAAGD